MKRRSGIGFIVLLLVGLAVVRFGGESSQQPEIAPARTALAFTPRAVANARPTTGRVTDRAGGPIAAALVVLATDRSRPVVAITGRDGSWATAIADGTYTVSVSAAGFLPSTRKIALDAVRETILDRGGVALHGTVEDLSGGSIGGAKIRFVDQGTDALIAVVVVDNAGHYTAHLPASKVEATAEAEGYATVTRRFDLRGRVIPPGKFRLSVGGTIRGTVVGPDGAPCREAVVFTEVGGEYHGQKLEATATATGEFEVAGLRPGEVAVHASGPGCATRDATLVPLGVGGVVEGVTISAERAFTLSGLVVERGTRAPVADVELRLDHDQLWITRGGAVRSDASGRYAIHGIRPGSYEIDVTPTKHLVELIAVEVAADTQHDLELARGRVISGRVEPPRVAKLELELDGHNAVELAARRKQAIGTTTKADGTFVIENAVDGALELAARSTDGTSFGKVMLAEQGDQRDVRIALEPFGDGVVVGVVVEESGAPVGGVEVGTSWPDDRVGETQKVFTSADGSFRFEHLPRRELGFFLVEDRVPVEPDKLRITPGDRSELRIVVRDQGGAIRGRVVDAEGKPAADVEITGMSVEGFQIPRGVTDATGSFVLADLHAGEYRIQATTPSGDGQTFVSARTGETVTLTLARTARIELTVTQAGKPIRDKFRVSCTLDARTASLEMPSISSFSTSSNGRSDGTYRSNEAYPLGRATCHIAADAGGAMATIEIGKHAELALAPWAKVHAVVADKGARQAMYSQGDLAPSASAVGPAGHCDYADIENGKLMLDQVLPGVGWIAIYTANFSKLLATRRIDATAGGLIDLGTIAAD